MSIVTSGLGCADCFSTCGGNNGMQGLGDCGFQPSDAQVQASGGTHADWLAEYNSWVACVNASQVVKSVDHTCPSGFEWDGLNGLTGCIPIPSPVNQDPAIYGPTSSIPGTSWGNGLVTLSQWQQWQIDERNYLNSESAKQLADLLAQQQWKDNQAAIAAAAAIKAANDKAAADLLAQQKAAEEAKQAKILAARNCPAGMQWDGIDGLGWLGGCVSVSPLPQGTTNLTPISLRVLNSIQTNLPPVLSNASVFVGIPNWLLLASAIGGVIAVREFSK